MTMTKLATKIFFLNIALFIAFLIAEVLVTFSLGYAESGRYNVQQGIIYISAGLIQTGVNFLIWRKAIKNDWRVLRVITLIVALLYVLCPIAMSGGAVLSKPSGH